MKTTVLTLLLVAISTIVSAQKGEANHVLHFDASGKLTGEPPEKLTVKESVDVVLTRSQEDVAVLINESAKKYVSLYRSLEFADVFFGKDTADALRYECLYNLFLVRKDYLDQLDAANAAEFAKLDHLITTASKLGATSNLPGLAMLLNPKYTLEAVQLDANGNELCSNVQKDLTAKRTDGIDWKYELKGAIVIAKNFDRFKLQVRQKNVNWDYFQQKRGWITPVFDEPQRDDLKALFQKGEISYLHIGSIASPKAKEEILAILNPLLTKLIIQFPDTYDAAEFKNNMKTAFGEERMNAFDWALVIDAANPAKKYAFDKLDLSKLIDEYLKDYDEKLKTIEGKLEAKSPPQQIHELEMQQFLATNHRFKAFKTTLLKYSKWNDIDALYARAKVLYLQKQENPALIYEPTFLADIKNANKFLEENIITELAKFDENHGKDLQDAVFQQLWFANAGWSRLDIIQKARAQFDGDDPDTDDAAQNAETLTNDIAAIQAQINYLDALSNNLTVHTKGDTVPVPDHYLELLKELYEKREEKKAALKKLEKTGTSPVSVSTPLLAKLGLETSDFFLNKVEFSANWMQHIDQSEKRFMNKRPVREINELEVMDVFIHNDKSAVNYVFRYTFEKDTDDITPLEEELAFSGPNSSGGAADVETFFRYYLLIQIYKEVVVSQFTGAVPATLPRSEKPKFRTNEVTARIKPLNMLEVPGKVLYTVLNPANDKDTIAQGAYRINKLYRFRYKIGPSYSTLIQKSYTLDNTAQTYTLDEKKAGFQTVFGLQYYFMRNDIRQPDYGWRHSFAFLGMNIGVGALENLYLGVGYEIVDGMSLTAGVHFGMSERLYSRNGVLAVDKRAWSDPGFFMTLGFDHGIFSALFKNNVRTSATEIFK